MRRQGISSIIHHSSFIILLSSFLFLPVLSIDSAQANLRLCNKTQGVVGITVGYYLNHEWASEGWWNLPADTCDVILPGHLKTQYYYIHAVDYTQGGIWGGPLHMCTTRKSFTIKGVENCQQRGFQEAGFFEIDTNTKESWTVNLIEPVESGVGGW